MSIPTPNGSIRPILVALFLGTLLIRGLTALSLEHAGYFDAFYYYHIALNMAQGAGLTESVIWNYLDGPESLPRPSNQYWMPLTNILAWLGIAGSGWLLGPWRAAQLPFVLLSSLLPPLAAWLSWQGWRRREWAISAGLLTIFSGFYFTYWPITDNYTPFALAVAIALLAIWRGQESGELSWWFVAGLGAGLSHLARVDGALLVPLIALLIGARHLRGARRNPALFLRAGTAAALGYLLLMVPWWLRNWAATGTPFPGGGTQTLWLTSYNEIFAYDPELTPARYLAWGLDQILLSKGTALFWSLLIVLGTMQFFLAPFVLAALRDAARRPLFRPFLLYTALLFTAMPLVFTFPARRGSLLHSSAALIPWMMALAPVGIERLVLWLAARRSNWEPEQATRILGGGFVAVAMIVTLYIYASGVWLPPVEGAEIERWNDRTDIYEEVEAWLAAEEVAGEEPILVSDPPAYYVTTRRPALVIPSEGPEMAAVAAREWEADWLLLAHDYSEVVGFDRMYRSQAGEAGWEPAAFFTDSLGNPLILFRLDRP